MAKKFERKNGTPFQTGVVRLNHGFLVAPDTITEFGKKDAVKKYKAELILPKSDKATLRAIKDALAEFGDVEKHPLINEDGSAKDGDTRDDAAYEDCYYFPVSSQFPITCCELDENGEAYEIPPSSIKNGDYVEAQIVPCLYDVGSVTFYLQALCKVEDGEPLASAAVNINVFSRAKQSAPTAPVASVKPAPAPEPVAPAKAALRPGRPPASASVAPVAKTRPSPVIPAEESEEEEDLFAAPPAPKAKKGKSFDALI